MCENLEKQNFKHSQIDACIFYSEDCIMCVYVDDVLIVADDEKKIDDFLNVCLSGSN